MAATHRNPKQAPDPKKVPDFTEEDLAEIKDFFDIFDEDGSGIVDLGEMLEYLEDLRVDKNYGSIFYMLKKVYGEFPKGATYKEFIEYAQFYLGDGSTGPGLTRLFNLFDLDKKGYLDRTRLKAVAREIGELLEEEDLDDLLENFFETTDDKVTADQFYRMMITGIF